MVRVKRSQGYLPTLDTFDVTCLTIQRGEFTSLEPLPG